MDSIQKTTLPMVLSAATKADIWEAGHRVPFFAHWPEKIAGDSKCNDVICHTDLLATFAEISGRSYDNKSAEDSFSFHNSLIGQLRKRPPVIHQSANGMLAIRSENWKLVMGTGSGGRQKPKGKSFEKPFKLFDLSNDLQEAKDLIETQSEKAEDLYRQFLSVSHDDHVSKKK